MIFFRSGDRHVPFDSSSPDGQLDHVLQAHESNIRVRKRLCLIPNSLELLHIILNMSL